MGEGTVARGLRALFVLPGALAGLLAATPATAAPAPDNGAVVVMYHRFGDSRHPSTNIRLEQFEQHVAELAKDKYTVLPVPEIVQALIEDRPLPDHAVGISIDDAYASVYGRAWPRLKAADLPFTLFVATAPVDDGLQSHMTWDQIRELAASDLVTIGSQTHRHPHMPELSPSENRADIERANEAFRRELGEVPSLFAYPYGEYGTEVIEAVREAGYTAAFGQHSGGIGRTADLFKLPRFALNEAYGGIDRFRLAANALPLPVIDVTPADNVLETGENPPLYGFTVLDEVVGDIGRLNCFASGRGRVDIQRIAGKRVEVRLDEPFPPGRARINCTMLGPDGRWRWFGNQFYVSEP